MIINSLQFGNYLNMILILFCIFIFVVYMFIVYAIVRFKKNNRLKYQVFPRFILKKDGISFTSLNRHRIKILGFDMVTVKDCLYLFNATKIILIENVNNVETNESYLYFSALGNVKIYCDFTDIYKYFSIIIKSEKFNMECLKQKAILDIIN